MVELALLLSVALALGGLLGWFVARAYPAPCGRCAFEKECASGTRMLLRVADARRRLAERAVADLASPAHDDMKRDSPCGRFSVGPRLLARWSKGGAA